VHNKAGRKRSKPDRINNIYDIIENISDGFFALDQNWCFVYVNRRAASDLGIQGEELIGQNIWDKFPQFKGTELELKCRKGMSENQLQGSEIRGPITRRWHNVHVRPSSNGIFVYWQDIEEGKKTKEALLQSKQQSNFDKKRLETILEAMPSAVVLVNASDDRFSYLNRRALDLYGFNYLGTVLEDHTAKLKAFKPDGTPYPLEETPLACSLKYGKEVRSQEMTIQREDGVRIPLLVSSTPVFDDQGNIISAIVTFEDIAEIKIAEEALAHAKEELETNVKQRTAELAESEEKYRNVVDNANEVIVIAQNGIIKFIGGKALEITGYSPKELISKPFLDVILPEDRELVMDRHQRRMSGEAVPDVGEFRILRKDGCVQWAHMNATDITWEKRPAVLALFTNVTARKQAEEALKTSQQKYQALTETTSDFIWETDSQGRYTYCSPQMKRLWGYNPQEWIGKTPFDAMLPEEKEQGIKDFMAVAQAQRPFSGIEVKSLDSLGRFITIEVSGVPYFDGNGRFSGYRGISRDITKRKRVEESLAEANNQLKQYSRRITQIQEEERKKIAYELHDDTAQYLSLLKLELDSLVHSGKIQDPEVLKKLEFLERDAGRAVDDVRRYSHELRPGILEHLGIQAALEQIAEDINRLGQIKVIVNACGEEQKLSEEVKLGLFRIAQEGINNARKHSKSPQAIISIDFQQSQVRMIISDDGIGFDMREVSARTALKGNLGLMSMQERAKLIGANLIIDSEPGKGTTVTVELSP
jgi:PAS domain S-box-containing protein